MKPKIKGCAHLHIKNGKITNVFSHLSNLPDTCIVHLKPDIVLTLDAFKKTHPADKDEVKAEPKQKVFDMGDLTYTTD